MGVLFWEAVESSGGGAQLEEVGVRGGILKGLSISCSLFPGSLWFERYPPHSPAAVNSGAHHASFATKN